MNIDPIEYLWSFEVFVAFTCAAVLSLIYSTMAHTQDINGRSKTFVISQQTISVKNRGGSLLHRGVISPDTKQAQR
jgi:hypothetical protein